MFVAKMPVEARDGINASGITGANFVAKGGDRGLGTTVVMQERVKHVEGIFGRLTTGEGAKFQRQKWPGFADADSEFLVRALKVQPSHDEGASRSQRAIDAGKDVGGNIVNHRSTLGRGRTFGEKIHWNGEAADLLYKALAAEFISGQTEPLDLEVHPQAAVLAEGGAEGDAEVGVERDRTRQVARCGNVAAEVLWDKTSDEHQVAVP